MKKLLTYITLLCSITLILADDCNNPLLAVFNFTGLAQPTTVSGLRFCKALQRGQSCCSADTVNAIQDKAKSLGDRLSAIVAARDRAIVETREKVIPGLQRSLQDLRDNSANALNRMRASANNSTAGNGNGTAPPVNLQNNTNQTQSGNPPPPAGNGTQSGNPPPPLGAQNGTNNTQSGNPPPPAGGNGTQSGNPPPPLNGTNNETQSGNPLPPPPMGAQNGTNNTQSGNPPPPPPIGSQNGTNNTQSGNPPPPAAGNETQSGNPPPPLGAQNGTTNETQSGNPPPPPIGAQNGTNNTQSGNPPPPPPPVAQNGTNETQSGNLPPPPPIGAQNGTNNTQSGNPPPPLGAQNGTNQTQSGNQSPPPPRNQTASNQTQNATANPPPPLTNNQATQVAESMQQLAQTITGNLSAIRADFNNFQKARTSCVVELIKLQSSAWCLACDPAYASKGVSGETIQLSDRVCRRLQSSCYKFISGSVSQSTILSVRSIGSIIDQVVAGMRRIADGDSTGLDDLALATQNATSNFTNSPTSARPVEMPEDCTSESQCPWICGNLITNGRVNENTLSAGGVITDPTATTESTSRLLLEEEEESVVKRKLQKKRVLIANEWDPDQDDSGVSVTFSDDPAGVANSSDSASAAGIVKASLVCLVGLLVALIF